MKSKKTVALLGVVLAVLLLSVGCGSNTTISGAIKPSTQILAAASPSSASPVARPSAVAAASAAIPGGGDITITLSRPTRGSRGGGPAVGRVSMTMGDAPGDRVLSFEITINSIVLTKSDNTTFTLFSGSRRIEATHLAGTFLPIGLAAAPQGTYTKAEITVSNPDVVFIGADGKIHKFEDKTLTRTVSILFDPALTIGSTAMVLNLDLDVASSLAIDPTNLIITVNPTLLVTPVEANNNNSEPENGELEHVVGTVTAVDTQLSQVTISVGQTGATLTVTVNSTTKIEVGDSKSAGLAGLVVGMLVRIEGATNADGTLVAKEIEASASAAGAEAEGTITKVTGNPATQVTLIADDGSGAGITAGSVGTTDLVGSPVVVNIADNTKFLVDAGNVNIDSTAFPFDAGHLSPGQRVEAESETEIEAGDMLKTDDRAASLTTSGALAARKVKLEAQALVGTVSSFTTGASSSQFTLTLDADSAFALLSGSTAVTVTVLPSTVMKNGLSLPPTSAATKVRVRGWVFFDGTSFKMIAQRIAPTH